ncbi:polyketide synthase [Paramyrothecium foliicola]|nr:polyketide synthase [Paramyrothecium foliicola]
MATADITRPSALVFSPQTSAPKRLYLAQVRSRLLRNPSLKLLKDAITQLPETWTALVASQSDLALLEDAHRVTQSFSSWIKNGESKILESNKSGIATLPLLTIIHIVQYFEYLQYMSYGHRELIESLPGGIQGHCIGLLSAMLVASSSSEEELIERAVAGIRLALAIGAFGDLAESYSDQSSTTVVLRLKGVDEGEKIVKSFPGVYISTITDLRTISVIVPDNQLDKLRTYANTNGLQARPVHIQSRLHHPDNSNLVDACFKFSKNFDVLPHQGWGTLYALVRSNRTGNCLEQEIDSVTYEVVRTILSSRCNWDQVIQRMAEDLGDTRHRQHTLIMLGLADSVPLDSFRQHNLEIRKLAVLTLSTTSQSHCPKEIGLETFPANAIAIVGAACRLPGANSLDELWELISRGESKLEHFREGRASLKESYRASQDTKWVRNRKFWGNYIDDIDSFDHAFFGISPREAKYMDPQQRLLLMTAFEAMDSSGYLRNHQRKRGDNVGCFIGASYTEYLENTSSYSPSAFTATGTIRAFLSGKISYHFGWSGPSEVIDTACSASIVAIHRACLAIKTGECPVALAGGVNLITGINNYLDLGKASFLSSTGQCKPFDESADGYCRADGVGLVVLKSLSQAVADGDHIMGVIPAIATNQGGVNAPGITVPDGLAQRALYKTVLATSGLDKEDVTYVEAHGTGTPVGDPIEVESIRQVFGGPLRHSHLYLGSLKGNIGHSETAAGVASLLKVLAMFRHKGIPPLRGFKNLNPKIPPLELDNMNIPTALIPWNSNFRVACVNSYGASGSNSALLCAEWPNTSSPPLHHHGKLEGTEFPILLSAGSRESLERYAINLATHLSLSNIAGNLRNTAFTLSQKRKHHCLRWSLTASDLSGLVNRLKAGLPKDLSETPKTPRKVVLTFSGQSRTNIGLDPTAWQSYPCFWEHITTCREILQGFGCPDIVPVLSQAEIISDPVLLQCGMVAVQYASARCWIDGGLHVDAIVGHSLGELTATAVSGVLSVKEMLKVVYARAKLIQTKWGPESGTMLAIHANVEIVQSIMDVIRKVVPHDDNLEIACYNSLNSHVVVGREQSIEAAEKILKELYHGVRYQRIGVSHGFHSRFTEPLLQDLVQLEKSIKFRQPFIHLETSSKTQFDFGTREGSYLAHHARDPVFFYDAVNRLEQNLGPAVWLEAGWGSPIISMTKRASLKPEIHTFQAVTSPALASANLWQEGIECTFWGFLPPVDKRLKHVWLPAYSFDSTKSWLDHTDHATEMQKVAMSSKNAMGTTDFGPLLVKYKAADDPESMSHVFTLNTNIKRYTDIVSGHAVRRKPLCPASVYMEAAVMATDIISPQLRGKTITFHNIVFRHPLGCAKVHDVALRINKTTRNGVNSWYYITQTSPAMVYSEGHLTISETPPVDFGLYQVLASDGLAALQNDPDSEKLKKKTAYSLFSRVVEYSDLLQGISRITLGSNQAFARIEVPNPTFAEEQSTVSDFFDAISLDNFIQVVGLLINSRTKSTEVYIASSIGNMVVTPTDFHRNQNWTVYATYSIVDSKTLSGAVFVFSEAGELVVFGSKIIFVKAQAAKLERVLDAAGSTALASSSTALKSAHAMSGRYTAVTKAVAIPLEAPASYSSSSAGVPLRSSTTMSPKVEELRTLISAYAGVKITASEDEASFASLGIDSLSSMELSNEMESNLGIKISYEDILSGSFKSISKLLCPPVGLLSNSTAHPIATVSKTFTTPRVIDSSISSSVSSIDDGQGLEMITPSDHSSTALETDSVRDRPHLKITQAPLNTHYRIDTVTYKEISDLEIAADIYTPLDVSDRPMPVALMIHGGGHLTLSRRAVRPYQTKFLLANGMLPVSIDYRLCPHVNVLDGPVADVRDACIWAQKDLAEIMAAKGIVVDSTKYVVIGWSTGGTLAMTTSWTVAQAGLPGPLAILSFYSPVEYNPEEPLIMGKAHAQRTMSLSQIRKALGPKPVTYHAFNSLDTTKLGWLQPGDARSELVLALIKEKNGMSLLFNDSFDGEDLPPANKRRAAAFSPLVQLRAGNYVTPTFIIFGDEDEIAPFEKAAEFHQTLKDQGIRNGFLAVKGAKHIFDLGLALESQEWNKCVAPGYEFLIDEVKRAHHGSISLKL